MKNVKIGLPGAKELFRRLDLNCDGIMDVNELGDAVASAYIGKFNEDERLWVKITKKSWVNQNDLIASVPQEHAHEFSQILKCLNFEGTVNLTLWQFIRAKGQAFRKRLDQLISEFPKIEIVEGSGARLVEKNQEEEDSKMHESTIMDIEFDEKKEPIDEEALAKIPRAKVIIKPPPQPNLKDLPLEKLGPPPGHPLYEVFNSYLSSLKPKEDKGVQTDPVQIVDKVKETVKKIKKKVAKKKQVKKKKGKVQTRASSNYRNSPRTKKFSSPAKENAIKRIPADKFRSNSRINSPLSPARAGLAKNSPNANREGYMYSPTRKRFGENSSVYNSPARYNKPGVYYSSNNNSPAGIKGRSPRYTSTSNRKAINSFRFYPKNSDGGEMMTQSMVSDSKTSPKRVVISGKNTTKWNVDNNDNYYSSSSQIVKTKDMYGLSKSSVLARPQNNLVGYAGKQSGLYRPDDRLNDNYF